MRRQATPLPEIIWGFHKPPVEMICPDPIGNGSPSQRIIGIRNPLSQCLTPASLVFRMNQCESMPLCSYGRKRARRCDFTRAFDVATVQYLDGTRRVAHDSEHCLRWVPHGPVASVDAGKIGLETVVFLLRYRIELVIMTTSAVSRDAHES